MCSCQTKVINFLPTSATSSIIMWPPHSRSKVAVLATKKTKGKKEKENENSHAVRVERMNGRVDRWVDGWTWNNVGNRTHKKPSFSAVPGQCNHLHRYRTNLSNCRSRVGRCYCPPLIVKTSYLLLQATSQMRIASWREREMGCLNDYKCMGIGNNADSLWNTWPFTNDLKGVKGNSYGHRRGRGKINKQVILRDG